MNTLKVFIASSMTEEERPKIKLYIDEVNKYLKELDYNHEFQPFIYGETAIPEGKHESQEDINQKARLCDIFILLATGKHPIGEITIEEYKNALSQHNESIDKRPYIKVFYLYENKDKTIQYYEKTNNVTILKEDFEQRLKEDLSFYIQWIQIEKVNLNDKETNFKKKFTDYLKSFHKQVRLYEQKNLSYENHIQKTDQTYRIVSKYFRRNFDDKLENIAEKSSLIILEGNTYSGKTRAAYELMSKKPEWSEYAFHIYRGANNSTINDLNNIRIDMSSEKKGGDVIFIDDCNEIINNEIGIIPDKQLWQTLRAIETNKFPQWGNTTIILTISGKLSETDKIKLYTYIFREKYFDIKNTLDELTVNFDHFDKLEFKRMTSEMLRNGYLTKENIRPGNYTIGSLFIDKKKIEQAINKIFLKNPNAIYTLRTLKLHWMFSSMIQRGNINDLRILYDSIIKNDKDSNDNATNDNFDQNIDELRKEALLITEKVEDSTIVMIDNFVIESITRFVDKQNTNAKKKDLEAAIKFAENEIKNNGDSTLNDKFECIEHMGYLLCDRNTLCDEDILFLICKIHATYFDNGNDLTICEKMIEICYENQASIYSKVFCGTAVSRLCKFDTIKGIIEEYKRLIEVIDNEYINTTKTLYKEIIYSMFSEQKFLTLEQENILLKYIFDSENKFKEPFDEKDLRHIISLKRMIPFINQKPMEIIDLIKESSLDNYPKIGNTVISPNGKKESRLGKRKKMSKDPKIENILLPQIGLSIMTTLQKTNSFNEFDMTKTRLIQTIKKDIVNDYIRRSTSEKFTVSFYKEITNIAKQYSYNDRKKLFDYLIKIKDERGPLDLLELDKNTANTHRICRIQTLNAMLELLDENEALNAYHAMKSRDLCDSYTFSMLVKNKFLGFEHLYHLIDKNNQKENNFLTQNQMLQKAETLSDAHTCLLLMGINDNDPSKLRDEYALGNYLSIKQVTAQMCIDIIKKWHNRNNKKILSEKTIGVILKKCSYKGLKDLFDESSTTGDNCFTKYGLHFEEIERARKNVVCLNYLFLKGNNKNDQEFLKAQFEKLLTENSTHNLVVNWQDNENTSILSSYMKIHNIFPTYKNLKDETDKLFEKYKDTLRKTHYTYAPLLWKIIEESKTEITKETAIDKINKTLVDAYKYFSRLYARKEVIQHMSHLYNYRLRLLKQEDYHIQLPYAYEDKIIKCTLSKYLDKLLQENTSYADGTFIFYVLKSMKEVDESIYNKISEIAQQNRKGINLDTLDSNKNKEKQEERLAEGIRKKIIGFENGEIKIDEKIIHNYSPIKLLWWLLKNGEIKYEHAKDYLSEHTNVKITQTYVNFAFKVIEKEYRYSKNGYKKMQELLKETEGNSTLYRSIEMFLSMLKATNNESELEETIKTFPNEYYKKPEYIDTYIRKHISFHHRKNWEDPNSATILLDKLTQIIRDNIDFINITIVNSYLFGLMEIIKENIKAYDSLKNEVSQTMKTCWTYLKKDGNINLGILFNNTTQILEADVQTYSFFSMYCSEIIHEMNVRFKCDFHYGYDKKKNCLYDTLKNYAFFYTNGTIRPSENDFNHLIEILENKCHQEIRREIYDNYILNTHKNLDEFWFILLRYSDLMCKEVIDFFKYKNKEFTVNLDRINELHLIYMDKKEQSNDWQGKIDEIYSKVSLKNKKLYEDIFK